ncbi:MAG: prepilin-type N-terminal cleavage/methylation domain-containing protein [Armatimonadetes bacterium]|nr:prepilin-type N-terminal cleavage/methylation domain-containing protein [Armatimonadota bacterium]
MRGSRGFTVVEMLIAAALFMVAVTAVIGVFPVSVRASHQAQGVYVASSLAERELEFTRGMSYDAVVPRAEKPYMISIDHSGVANEINFNTVVEVVEEQPGLKRVIAQVTWTEPDSLPRTVQLETYVARLDP